MFFVCCAEKIAQILGLEVLVFRERFQRLSLAVTPQEAFNLISFNNLPYSLNVKPKPLP